MSYCIIGIHQVFGQESEPVVPTPVPVPTPTLPNPNFQYLPQKAAVTVYNPEIGIPPNTQPLQVVPQVQPQASFGIPPELLGIGSMIGAGVAYLKGHSSSKEAKMGIALAKKVMSGEVRTKEQLFNTVSTMFELAPEEKVAAMEGTKPSIKLENLQKDKAEFADEAAKA